jgi:hypothetical protein
VGTFWLQADILENHHEIFTVGTRVFDLTYISRMQVTVHFLTRCPSHELSHWQRPRGAVSYFASRFLEALAKICGMKDVQILTEFDLQWCGQILLAISVWLPTIAGSAVVRHNTVRILHHCALCVFAAIHNQKFAKFTEWGRVFCVNVICGI